jgi:hypothetical protein
MKNWTRWVALMAAGGLVAVPGIAMIGGNSSAQPLTYQRLKPIQQRILSGAAAFALSGEQEQASRAAAKAKAPSFTHQTVTSACASQIGDNVKVNQNCLNITDPDLAGRGQAQNETSIAQNPMQPGQLVSSFNDYRRGDGNCYAAYSSDKGRSWQDSTVPMGFTRGTAFGGTAREYWQGGGDTSVAWDTRGNAYLSCQVFKRGVGVTADTDQSSAFYVFRSTGTGGASWNFTGRPVVENNDLAGAGDTLLDKQLLAVDNHVASPFRDRVYVTWTLFAADGTAYIYSAHSADYGETFSPPVLVSANSALCVNAFDLPTPHGGCNENQFSQPFVGPDGALYVTWANFNNGVGRPVGDPDSGGENGGDNGGNDATTAAPVAQENYNQILLAKSTDGGASFSAPVLVGQYYDLPDCAAYQGGADPGRACVPETNPTYNSIFRATNYPVGSVSPRNGKVAVTFGSYINSHSNESNGCVPAGFAPSGLDAYTGVKVAGACNNDILLSVSGDGGATFTGATVNARALPSVRPEAKNRVTDQFFQWAEFTPQGDLTVAYRDRSYGNDQATGYTDTSISGSRNLATFAAARASSGASPPPTEFGGVFAGDYEGLTSVAGVHPIWTDSRAVDLFLCPGTGRPGIPPSTCTASSPIAPLANDENAYTASKPVPVP